MPKVIELTIEIEVQRVSCPGVWLCQDGRVSLTVFALGTSYQTCLLPPAFPLTFRDVFYFRKRFQESCALNNICCLLQDETIYCELVQWCEECASDECVTLAQYLGALSDVLFPPNMCSTDGVDLLMRRSKDFPGILSPKIEIATKVRIDEVWNTSCNLFSGASAKACLCSPPPSVEGPRQKQVCHSAQYHRSKCNKSRPSRSRSRSNGSRSCCSLEAEANNTCRFPNSLSKSRVSLSPCRTPPRRSRPCRQYNVYPVHTATYWGGNYGEQCHMCDDDLRMNEPEPVQSIKDVSMQKRLLESRYVEVCNDDCATTGSNRNIAKVAPCVCEICKRYHELFHNNEDS